jgi:uncharacterized repeat protein (TIGR01451 family)
MTEPTTMSPALPPANFDAPAEPAYVSDSQFAAEPQFPAATKLQPSSQPEYAPPQFASNNFAADVGNDADPYAGSATINVAQPASRVPLANASPEPSYSPEATLAESEALTGNGKPGPAELEGPQNPSLTVTKKSPSEVQVGKPAKFHVTVRNNGQVAAHDVLIRDEVPHGTQLVTTNPPATRSADGAVLWQMGTLRAGSELTVMMEIMPLEEGDVGSVATVSFQTSASARSIATRPQLTVEHSTARQALVGEDVVFAIKITNPGSGIATNVVIEEDVPPGLQHYDGNELEYPIGSLKPGESRMLELTLKAEEAGLVENLLIARADGNLVVEDRCQLEVVAPQLQIEIVGPRRRYLERKANYEVHVANPGTAVARNVEVVAHLPRALKFVSTSNSGQYDATRHEVVWNLAELPAQEMGTVSLETVPTQMGDHSIQVDARASMGLVDAVEHGVSVDGLAALLYTVTDVSDPIEVGGQTTYEIHVVNQGSKTATNLRLGALVPAGMEPINGEGPTRVALNGAKVVFEPLPRLAPQADTFYKIHVKGTEPGDKRIQVQLMSDEVTDPVTKEESTHVYADQ